MKVALRMSIIVVKMKIVLCKYNKIAFAEQNQSESEQNSANKKKKKKQKN